jgi:CrcB protein
MELIWVGLGGFVGSVLRYGAGLAVRSAWGSSFPLGTLLVNMAGCLMVGLVNGWAEKHQAFGTSLQLFVSVGILGGFTTFSAFGWETLQLMKQDQASLALANIAANLVLGLACVWLGRGLSGA